MEKEKLTQQNLEQIRAILKRELQITDEQVNLIFRSMTSIESVVPHQLDNVIRVLKTYYTIKNDQLFKLLNSNPPAELFKLDNLLSKMKLFNKLLGTSIADYKFALLNNPHAFARTDDELESYIFELKRDLNMNDKFVFNLLTRTNDFAHNMEDFIPIAKLKMEYLYAMGITPEQIAARPGLLGNAINSISTRLIFAFCNDIPIDEYLEESLFISTEAKIHARTAAYRAGLIKKEHIYVPESSFVGLTGYKTNELKKVFPFNMHERTALLNEFGERFPELSAISFNEYKRVSGLIDEYKQKQAGTESFNDKSNKESSNINSSQILAAIKVNLNEPKLSAIEESIILKNFDRLVSMGFNAEEVIAHPQSLRLTSDRLMWRAKLAKINGLPNTDFLKSYYTYKEMIIFPRTCGVKIMNTRTKATVRHIYNSEMVFARTFGESTKKLAEHCKLNETGRKLIDKLYMQAVNAESTQEENE